MRTAVASIMIHWNRREWLAGSTLAAFAPAARGAKLEVTSKLYESIGVRPFINCKGTYTILTGSQSLPEVKQAMMEASKHYVHLDELMDGVAKRIAEITKAEYGIVTAGCAAAIAHATAACIAGADPEKMQRLPKLDGMKDHIVMPRYARNVYDHAARMTGVNVVEVETEAQMRAALGPKTAMILIMSQPAAEKGPLSIENTARIAREKKVPLLVDAAAETLTIPNIHLAHGATMVAYSGGKCMRGPQAAGLLLGPKDLLRAAWLNSAPHHAFGRALKAGKEEIMGMLAALEMWTVRNQDAEWKQWESWLGSIKDKVTKIPGVTSEIVLPEDLSNHAPQLRLKWDAAKVGITGKEVARALDKGSPRILLADSTGERPTMASSVMIMPYMMQPGEHTAVAQALFEAMSHPPKFDAPVMPSGEAAKIGGTWTAELHFIRGTAAHQFSFTQSGDRLEGNHKMEFLSNALHGEVHAREVQFRSAHRFEGTVLEYEFQGTVDGDSMKGKVRMGEYGTADFTARRV